MAVVAQSLVKRFGRADAVRDVSFEVPKGEFVVLQGASGSGKTTLAGLLPRFYTDYEGHILLDGRELSDYQLDNLRSQIALVSQNVVLFNDTVAGNIAYGGLAGASREAIMRAAADAHAMEFIEQLPDGLDTLVGERGGALSVGERQLVTLARAAIADPDLLVLDEATSAVDPVTEARLTRALHGLTSGRTVVTIAHRLSTITTADQILVMQRGQVRERGTHESLLREDGLYRRLYELQVRQERGAR